MAVVRAGDAFPISFEASNIGTWAWLWPTGTRPDYFAGDYRFLGQPGSRTEFFGYGITYTAEGLPVGGTVTGYRETLNGMLSVEVTGVSVSVPQLNNWTVRNASMEAMQTLLAGGDHISGSPYADRCTAMAETM
ncbi:hypothetical protein [Teichococcus aestuarii]|uniref:hypothetical protein n=1 Tax=Teichococcus aestuarii TaxID=568898 RepID=UPI003613C187